MADERLLPAGIADDRSRAMLEVLDRLDAVDRSVLLLYYVQNVPEQALYPLAWQFFVTGLAGWDLAATDDRHRELVLRALELHRHRGTPWAITEALKICGWPSAHVEEGWGRVTRDGSYTHDGTLVRNPGIYWPRFRVAVGDVADDHELTAAEHALIQGLIEFWKNGRSRLMEIGFSEPAMTDAFRAAADSPLPLTQTNYHWHDGRYHRDGTITRTGTDLVNLGAE